MHYYYIFWVHGRNPNRFYHSMVEANCDLNEFMSVHDMTDIEEFFIRDCTTEEEMHMNWNNHAVHRKEGKLPLKEN